MIIAIDKNIVKKVPKIEGYEYIYVFEDEDLKDLLKLNLHCIHKDYIREVDINLTDYKMEALKKCKITDKDWMILPDNIDYKFAIIVPNYNNDHRRI